MLDSTKAYESASMINAKTVLAKNVIVSLDQSLGCDWTLKCAVQNKISCWKGNGKKQKFTIRKLLLLDSWQEIKRIHCIKNNIYCNIVSHLRLHPDKHYL